MGFLFYLVLILLSLLAYSGGAVWRAGKAVDIKPEAPDLVIVIVVWSAAIASRLRFGINRWLHILAWIVVSLVLGCLATALRRRIRSSGPKKAEAPKIISGSFPKKIWEAWTGFSRRMGGFQSRILLSFFFFLVVSPLALAVKLFSDPLRIRCRSSSSHWLQKHEIQADLEALRKQF